MPPKTTNAQLKRKAGAVVHALAHFALGERTAKKYYGNKRWNSYYLRGVVVSSTDGKTKPNDRAQWMLNVDFDIVETDGTHREVMNRNILANNCQSGEIPTGANNTIVVLTGKNGGNSNRGVSNTATTADGTTTATTTAAIITATTTAATTDTTAHASSATTASATAPKRKKKKKGCSDGAADDSTSVRTTSPQNKKRSKKNSKDAPINLTETLTYVETKDEKKHRVVAIANGRKWVDGNARTIVGDVAKSVDPTRWYQKTRSGEKAYPGNAAFEDMSCLEAFQHMMPPDQINLILELTSKNLVEKDKKEITRGELFRFIGVCMLMALYDYKGERRLLWGEGDECGNSISKYIPAIDLRKTQMTRNRWEEIWYEFQTSRQPLDCPPDMSPEAYRWLLIEDFIANFNKHRKEMFCPGSRIEADESMCRWYGAGDDYINHGLPHYSVIDRKPDNGLELQNIVCVESGIMLYLKLVKSAKEEARNDRLKFNEEELAYGKGTRVILELTKQYAGTRRLVTGDSFFASVEAAVVLESIGLKFIGNVKVSSREHPKKYLDEIHMFDRGDRHVLASIDEDTGETELVAMTFLDSNRRDFIGTTYGLGDGETIERKRDRQVDTSHNALPSKVIIDVPQPLMISQYHECVGNVDFHNRVRQSYLGLEYIPTKEWSRRANLSILGMILVDTALFYKHIAQVKYHTFRQFFGQLADELIDNTVDDRALRSTVNDGSAATSERPVMRKTSLCRISKGKKTSHHMQGRCKCKSCEGKKKSGDGSGNPKTSFVCSACTRDDGNNPQQWWLCSSMERPGCWRKHCQAMHSDIENMN